jgi:diadenosine tetraphosphatase ApaH/serine/threonine PP2A family protein phosphatase
MRYAIIADIHANLAAFRAVLKDIDRKGGVDTVWCLGDIVGYGPDPGECIDLVRECSPVCVAGNHDRAVIDKIDLAYFNPLAAEACRWTMQQLGSEHIEYLENLPLTSDQGDFYLVHGSPVDPVLEYVISTGIAMNSFRRFENPYCLVGHTHAPLAFRQEGDDCISLPLTPNVGLLLGKSRMIINPGGVGQPRDGDPRAAYAIYDSESNMFRPYRVEYNISATQDKMMKAGLPIQLITRLDAGR